MFHTQTYPLPIFIKKKNFFFIFNFFIPPPPLSPLWGGRGIFLRFLKKIYFFLFLKILIEIYMEHLEHLKI